MLYYTLNQLLEYLKSNNQRLCDESFLRTQKNKGAWYHSTNQNPPKTRHNSELKKKNGKNELVGFKTAHPTHPSPLRPFTIHSQNNYHSCKQLEFIG